MKTFLKISNFKCFQNEEFEFKKLNVLVGANGMGKSTVLQAMLLIRQCVESKNGKILLNGPFALSLGTYDSVISNKADNNIISFVYYKDGIELFRVSLSNSSEEDAYSLDIVHSEVEKYEDITNKCFYFLSAERTGPRIVQKMADWDYMNVGCYGEFAAQVLAQRYFKIDEMRKCPGENSIYLFNQVNAWLNYILPNNEVTVEANYKLQVAQIKLKNTISDDFVEATNLGFGISYCLPIIITGLIAEKDSCLLIENPEAHLHPAAQTAMGKFLAMLANSGLRVVVETHSDHILDGIQIFVANNRSLREDVLISNFGINDIGSLCVNSITYNENMEYSDWPRGFMDTTSENYSEFLNANKKDV